MDKIENEVRELAAYFDQLCEMRKEALAAAQRALDLSKDIGVKMAAVNERLHELKAELANS